MLPMGTPKTKCSNLASSFSPLLILKILIGLHLILSVTAVVIVLVGTEVGQVSRYGVSPDCGVAAHSFLSDLS